MPYIFAMGAVLCWASLPAAIGSGLEGLSVTDLMGISFTSAAVFLVIKDIITNKRIGLYFPGIKAGLLGVWGIFLYHLIYYKAMETAPMAEGTILATTWSFWIVIFSSVIRFKALKPAVFITALAGMAGAGLVISAGKTIGFNPDYLPGYALALLCGLIWSSFSVALPYFKLPESPMTAFTIYAAIISDLLCLGTGGINLPTIRPLLSAVYLGCVPLGLSFYFWDRAITTGNLTIIGYLSYLTPPLAVLMVALIHGGHISVQVIAGMAVIIASSILGKIFIDRSGQKT